MLTDPFGDQPGRKPTRSSPTCTPTRTNKGKEPYLTIVIRRQMTSYLHVALHSPVTHHPRTMWKPSPKRDLLAIPVGLSMARVAGCEDRPAEIDPIWSWPLSICLPGSGVWPPSFYLRSARTGRPLPCTHYLIPLDGDRMTCLSSFLGQHILDYEPPREFVIPSFSIYDGSYDSYDHMLHFNQVMILNAGNDRLLCKVFSASLKGPALAWFHKLPRGSLNSFDELWATFVSQYLCSVR